MNFTVKIFDPVTVGTPGSEVYWVDPTRGYERQIDRVSNQVCTVCLLTSSRLRKRDPKEMWRVFKISSKILSLSRVSVTQVEVVTPVGLPIQTFSSFLGSKNPNLPKPSTVPSTNLCFRLKVLVTVDEDITIRELFREVTSVCYSVDLWTNLYRSSHRWILTSIAC